MKKIILFTLLVSLFISCEGLITTGNLEGTWDGEFASLYFNSNGNGDFTAGNTPLLFTYTFDETTMKGIITTPNGSGEFVVEADYSSLLYNSYTYTKRK